MVKKKIKSGKIIRLLSNQSGMALLTTLIFVFILVTLAVALLTMTSNDIKLSALQCDSTKAFFLAEAGIQRAIKEVKPMMEDPSSPSIILTLTPPTGNIGDGTYTVEVHDHDYDPLNIPQYHVRITSTGKVNKPEREIVVFVKQATSEGMHPIFNYAIASKGKLELQNKGVGLLVGNIYCEGIIKNGTELYVDGTAIATEEIENYENEQEYYDEVLIGPEHTIEFPTLTEEDMNDYRASAQSTGHYYGSDDIVIENGENGDGYYDLDGRTIFFEGNVEFKNTIIRGQGAIVAEGWIIISNDSVVGIPDSDPPNSVDIAIISNASPADGKHFAIDISAESNYRNINAFLFAPNGYINVETNGKLYGSVIAGGTGDGEIGAKVEAAEGIYYPGASTITDYFPDDETIVFSIASWQEK